VRVSGEVVARLAVSFAELEVITADQAYARIVAVVCQELIAVSEKARLRQAVIFEDNALFLVLEEPTYRAGHRFLASKVGCTE
jgi:hypothetical protein